MSQYAPVIEVEYYNGRDNLFSQIDYFLGDPDYRRKVAAAGQRRTMRDHTYRARVEQLIRTARERLGI
jgi:spore maturation protein CgeB